MLKPLNQQTVRDTTIYSKNHPIKVLQFGEGNFLRAFVDWIIDLLNEKAGFNGSVQIVQPIEKGMADVLAEQDGLYHLILQGIQNGESKDITRLITSVKDAMNPYEDYQRYLKLGENPDLQFIISNTTEAGIAFDSRDTSSEELPNSFPGKLTALLHHRFQHFNRNPPKDLVMIPCELIDKNGSNLRQVILQYCDLWKLDGKFKHWVSDQITFCNTLVDRIVPGYPRDKAPEIEQQIGYKDKLIATGEYFHLWVIEGPDWIRTIFPTDKAGLNVKFVSDQTPYRTRKVRILNGLHTTMVPVGILYGLETVREAVTDDVVGTYLQQVLQQEIIPTLDLPEDELSSFANDVLDRFRNPYIKHHLMSISLNSISKYKVRVLPSVLKYIELKDELPKHLLFSLASLIRFYKGEWQGKPIQLNDDKGAIAFIQDAWKLDDYEQITNKILGNKDFWGQDLTRIDHLSEKVSEFLEQIDNKGMQEPLKSLLD